MSDQDYAIYTDLGIEEEESSSQSPSRKLRNVIADAFTFIRSMEVNQAIATVTLEQLMVDQIARNGESAQSNAAQFDPYGYDPEAPAEASSEAPERANFLGGADTNRPTKMDRLMAIMNAIDGAIAEIKKLEPVEVASAEEYVDIADIAAPEED